MFLGAHKWHASPFNTGRSFVAAIPGRPESVAVKSIPKDGSGERLWVLERKVLDDAVKLWMNQDSFPPCTTEAKQEAHTRDGTIRGKPSADGHPGDRFMRATEADAIAAILQGPEVYDILDKWVALACFFRLKDATKQREMINACGGKCYSEEYEHLFSDEGVHLPIVTAKAVFDNGRGRNADYYGSVFTDETIIFALGNMIFGGAQRGDSTSRGATRLLVVGSEEDYRITKTEASSTTTVEWTLTLPLCDAVVLSCRRCALVLHLLSMYYCVARGTHGYLVCGDRLTHTEPQLVFLTLS